MRIWTAAYELQPHERLSGRASSGPRSGALIKIETRLGVGYADIHPWPELGDEPLKDQLASLLSEKPLPLAARSLELAVRDLDFRSRSQSAFAGLRIPASHWLVTDIEEFTETNAEDVWRDGFRTLKIKVGRDLAKESARLHRLMPVLTDFKLRLDFNALLSPEVYISFIGSLPSQLWRAIEFIEDPFPWDPRKWEEAQRQGAVPLALDRLADREIAALESGTPIYGAFDWIVAKPAVQSASRLLDVARKSSARLCITSYLDHPIGQAHAAYEAAVLDPRDLGTCGLVSHHAYEWNEFSEKLGTEPVMTEPRGTGIGFDELLKKQDWKELR